MAFDTVDTVLDSKAQSNKDFASWMYLFHGVSLVFSMGLLSFIPLIANYIKIGETEGTFVHSHHRWQIRSFWFFLLWLCVGGLVSLVSLLWFAGLGWGVLISIPVAVAIWVAAWIWKAYRIIKGWLDLSNNKTMPMPG